MLDTADLVWCRAERSRALRTNDLWAYFFVLSVGWLVGCWHIIPFIARRFLSVSLRLGSFVRMEQKGAWGWIWWDGMGWDIYTSRIVH